MRIIRIISPLLFSLCAVNAYSLGDPVAIYCNRMGYEYVLDTNDEGDTKAFCILPDGTKVEALEFFKGKVKPEYSYCGTHGYGVESVETEIGDAKIESAYCIKGKKLRSADGTITNGVPMVELMSKNNDDWFSSDTFPVERKSKNVNSLKATTTLPTSYDSRSLGIVNDVRSQGWRGTCWAFATAACSEITYNKFSGSTNNNRKRLSESFIIWCLGGNASVVNANGRLYKTCNTSEGFKDTGWMSNAMSAVQDNGVCLLESYPYTLSEPMNCDHWNDPRIFPGKHISFSKYNDDNALKELIYQYGCVGVNLNVGDGFKSYSSGVFDMSKDYGEMGGHSVVLIGWGVSNSNEEYWILRNSWDTNWGENGYMKLKISTAHFWQADYMAPGDYIFKSSSISENNKVPANGNVSFVANNSVRLMKGFKVTKGGKFIAKRQNSTFLQQTEVHIPNCGSGNTSSKGTSFELEDGDEVIDAFDLYPNPSDGIFNVSFGEEVVTVSVYDMMGKVVRYYSEVSGDLEIDLTNEANGIYNVVMDSEKHHLVKKVVKQ